MKKQLLSIFGLLAAGTMLAQAPGPNWATSQNAAYTFTNNSVGIRFIDAIDQNVVWTTGYDGFAPTRNYNNFSRTINGGNNWNTGVIFTSTMNAVIGDTSSYVLSNLSGIDANTAWVCAFEKPAPQGGGVIYRTSNGGTNWVNMTPPGMFTNTAAFGNFVAFLTPSVGIVNGDPVNNEFELWRTTDGGLSWSTVAPANIPNPNANEFAIVDLYAKQGTSNLWFATNQGRMYRTTDAGVTWSVATVCPPTRTVTEIAFASPLNGVVYVADATTFYMYNTTDGGVTWNQITTVDPNVGKNEMCAIPGTGMYASAGAGTGNQLLSYSMDNGVTWTDWGSTNIQYLTLDFVDGSTGWAGGFSNSTDPTIEGITKYTGPNLTGTVVPTAAFTIPSYICGPAASVGVNNTSTGSGALTYSWTSSPAVVFSSATASNPSITFSGNNTYTITLTVTSGLGSNVSSQVINILNCAPPVASFTMISTVCNNISVLPSNTSVNNPAANYSWSASPSTGVTYPNSSTAFNPAIKFANAGTYTVTLSATNIGGTTSTTRTITVNDCSPIANFNLNPVAYGCAGFATPTSTDLSVASGTASYPGHVAGNVYTWNILPTTQVTITSNGPAGKILEFSFPGTYTVTLKVANGSGTSTPVSMVIEVHDCGAVGISENAGSLSNVSLYPNPAHDVFTVSMPSSGNQVRTVKLTNLLGAVVYEEKTTLEKMNINVAGKAKGVYFLSVESNGNTTTKKVVVE